MNFFITLALTMGFAYADSNLKANKDSTPPTPREGIENYQYEEYQPNDGSARPGNPGTFTSKGPKSSVPETNLEMKNHPKPKLNQEMQAEEAEFDVEVLK